MYSLDIRFKKPAFILDKLDVVVFVESVEDYRLSLGYKIRRGEELLLRASSGIAFMDTSTRMIVPAPDRYIEKIKEFL